MSCTQCPPATAHAGILGQADSSSWSAPVQLVSELPAHALAERCGRDTADGWPCAQRRLHVVDLTPSRLEAKSLIHMEPHRLVGAPPPNLWSTVAVRPLLARFNPAEPCPCVRCGSPGTQTWG